MKKLIQLFTQHPKEVQESYFQHLKFTIINAYVLLKCSAILLVHGIFPFLFLSRARDLILKLSEKFLKRNPINKTKNTATILDYIGNTPLLHLHHFHPAPNIVLYGKCEFFNPTLSIKDRIVLSMLQYYAQNGDLKPGATIYEASSGNTGSSLAMIGRKLGYQVVITVPQKTSDEKVNTMKLFGAQVIITQDGLSADSPEHYVNKARILSEADNNGFYFNQYGSSENVMAHYRTTAFEIWQQTHFNVDYAICPASSGGTITGVGRFLKEKNPEIKIILPDPVGSVFYDFFHGNKLQPKSYKIEGAGKDKICSIHDFSLIDDVIQFTDDEAFLALKKLAHTEGVLVGGSSGGALAVAEKLIKTLPNDKNITIVVMLPDSGFKYLSKIPID